MKNLLEKLRKDLPASIVVFLVALPLCLGIALASGAPLLAGLIAGIIGGVVVGSLSGSALSVSGPAAGLVVIVLNAVSDLGGGDAGYKGFLLAVVLAGLIQFILGTVKAGIIGSYFPSAVIKGMLAAIGLILILKQIPHLVGFDSDAFGEMEFIQSDHSNTITYLFSSFEHVHIGASIVGIACLLVMIFWDQPFIKKHKVLSLVPAGGIAVVIGVLLNYLFEYFAPSYIIRDIHMVNLPIFESFSDVEDKILFPDFAQLSNPKVYLTAVILAIVASLETLLSVEAVDKLDSEKRRTPKNRELRAQGIGNMFSGLIGGLPITAVIVRSSANTDAGAKSKISAVLHGIWLILAVALFPVYMNEIPLASLAAILLVVGYKLTKPILYVQQWKVGREQFVPFIVTILAILFSDLLIGIGIGLAVGIFFILQSNHRVTFHYQRGQEKKNGRDQIKLVLSEHVSFLNKASLFITLDEIPENSDITIDGSTCVDIHYDALEVINTFSETAKNKNITVHLENFAHLDTTNKN